MVAWKTVGIGHMSFVGMEFVEFHKVAVM